MNDSSNHDREGYLKPKPGQLVRQNVEDVLRAHGAYSGDRNWRLPVAVEKSVANGYGLVTNGSLGADLIQLKQKQAFAPHTHDGDHLLYVVSGFGTVTIGGVIYDTEPGDIYMVPGHIVHAVGARSEHIILAIGAPHSRIGALHRMNYVCPKCQREHNGLFEICEDCADGEG